MADEKKTQKPAEKKPSFIKGVKTEAKKVTWYPKKTTLKNTVWVIIALVIFGGIIGLIDVGFQALLGLFA
ncbi:MAG: preprotein translocase subunit SecE [Clostridia bacterium]|nr:preprotein translocase subunit SecE [Clostridia bacterium]